MRSFSWAPQLDSGWIVALGRSHDKITSANARAAGFNVLKISSLTSQLLKVQKVRNHDSL